MRPDPPQIRRLAKALGTFHNISYYAPEMKAFARLGLPEYWRAYMAYRSAPMGTVPASVVASTFYNFSPSRVREALPSAWETTTPGRVLTLRNDCIGAALTRALGDADMRAVAEATELALAPIMACEAGARPLFSAHRELAVPTDPLMKLWFATTLWREHRGDGHNIALAAASIDGIECHVLLAAKGVASQEIITKIRGWTNDQWHNAHDRLGQRGLIAPDGSFTDAGKKLRADIETHTDELAEPPHRLLGPDATEQLLGRVEPLVAKLVDSGAVAGKWPPPKPPR